MNRWTFFSAAALLVAATAALAGKPAVVPGAWIVALEDPPTVEFEGGAPESVQRLGGDSPGTLEATAPSVTGARKLRVDSPAVQAYVKHLDAARARVLADAASALDRKLEPRHVYRHVLNGFSAEMSDAEARRLAELPGVKSVEPVYVQTLHTDAGPEWINAPEMWSGSTGAPNPNRGEGTVIGVIDSGINYESIFFDTSESSEPVSNPRGQFFGLCNDSAVAIPCNDKLIGVYDFTEEGTNGFDPDGHGSHTASTAAGLPLTFTFNLGRPIEFSTSGVAPRASIISYKACREPDEGQGGFTCDGDFTTAALEQAIEDGVDVINYSIGGDPFNPWSESGNQRLFLNVREAGIVPVTSAGNSGRDGDATVGSPANTPWVVAVANATHGRLLANRLVDTSGGTFPLGELTGEGFTQGVGPRRIVHARDFGNALCGTGAAELGPSCSDNTGASNPFAPGTFNGQIVVCDRGTYGRVEKGFNVKEAGAGGMILANTDAQGESTVPDEHCLPATHVGDNDGDRLRDWLGSGSNHSGRLTGTLRFISQQRAGRLAASSSRGPAVGANGVMKPNVTAPGTDVLAALTETNPAGNGPGPDAANQAGFLSGTSMSSPHVAGAALLLRSAHPDWDVDAVISALETTADADIVTNGDGSEARIIDRGAGGIQVDRAAQAGLYLPVTEQEFLDANPAGLNAGDPQSLNLAGLIDENCVGTCTFTRTLRALGTGSWTVSAEGDLEISVSPTSFSLSEGQQQQIQVEVSRGRADIGEWGSGSVVLSPNGGDFTTQRLPVGILVAPAELPSGAAFESVTNRGRDTLIVPEVIPLDEFVVRTSALVRPEQREASLSQDSTRDDPFDGPSGTETVLVDVPADSLLLHAETFDSQASDVDLFVGFDADGDGEPEASEEVCQSRSLNDLELCDIERPAAGTWWIVVQNWASSGFGANRVPYEFAVLADADDPSLVAPGPGATDGGQLELPIYWDQPAMEAGERWFGVVGLASSPVETADLGTIPLTITRTGENEPAERALFNDENETVVIPAETTHDLLYIDVPDYASTLSVTVEGEADAVTIRRRGFDAIRTQLPGGTPPAPEAVLAEAERTSDGLVVEISAGENETLDSGRYYVVVDNSGVIEQRIDVRATVSFPTVSAPLPGDQEFPRRGLWGPETRAINQGVDFQVGGGGRFAVWYTYDEDGLPTFYITETIDQLRIGFFKAVLFRPTSNDVQSNLEVVGEVQITALDEDRFMFAWRLNGNHGAELFDPVNGTTCPDFGDGPVPLLGHWFSPTTTAGGATVLITDSAEAWIRYFYDDSNEPRWVLADTQLPATVPGGERMEVLDFRGFCIYCTERDITFAAVGTLERQFLDADTAREISDFVTRAPLNVDVDIDRQIELLSNPVSCPGG